MPLDSVDLGVVLARNLRTPRRLFGSGTFLEYKADKIVFPRIFGTTPLGNQYRFRCRINLDKNQDHTAHNWFRWTLRFSMFSFQLDIGRKIVRRNLYVAPLGRQDNRRWNRGR